MRPASIWQLLPVRSWVAANQAYCGAFFQCAFGAASPMPTRLLHNILEFNLKLWEGMPHLDERGHYLGPLPSRCSCTRPHQTLIRKTTDGAFATSATAAYPPRMDSWLAKGIFSALLKGKLQQCLKVRPRVRAQLSSAPAPSPRSPSASSVVQRKGQQDGRWIWPQLSEHSSGRTSGSQPGQGWGGVE